MAKQTVSAPGGGNTLVLGQRYELVPGNRLPELDSPHAEAFGVSNLKTTDPPHFALLSHGGVLPRVEVLESFARADRGPLLRPVEWRAVPWGPAGGYRYAIVFRRPSGRRVLTGGEANFQPWRPDIIVRHVIRPLLPLLKDLSERGLTHRAIRAENLFYADGESGSVVLGECVSAPPGLAQDAIYESIENGMAEPEGRNDGRPGDDLYAFGVLLLVLLTGGNPCAGMTAAEIVAAKLKRGAYGALVGRTKVPINMMEPLRGLLCDDPAERWHVEDLELWLGGRTLTPKQPSLPPKATRPFRFAGEECWDMRSLAHAMAHNWSEAAQALKGRQIVEWVQRSLSQEARAEAIDDAL
ncbi:MAG: serine/threonine protein kinase, partial [Rhodospirillales bacterium]|nr:serine/threonine protein kinase [Rhodospirillales bacterium]